MRPAPIEWPDGKRVAVLNTRRLESWSDGKSPSYFTCTTPLKPGADEVLRYFQSLPDIWFPRHREMAVRVADLSR